MITRRLLIALAALLFSLGLSGCNTMEGMGEDIESAGQAIDREAEEANE